MKLTPNEYFGMIRLVLSKGKLWLLILHLNTLHKLEPLTTLSWKMQSCHVISTYNKITWYLLCA